MGNYIVNILKLALVYWLSFFVDPIRLFEEAVVAEIRALVSNEGREKTNELIYTTEVDSGIENVWTSKGIAELGGLKR